MHYQTGGWVGMADKLFWNGNWYNNGENIHFFLLKVSLHTFRPIEAKIHMEPPCIGGMKVNTNGLCHMTKMAAMPIYGKTLKIFFSVTERQITLKLSMQH